MSTWKITSVSLKFQLRVHSDKFENNFIRAIEFKLATTLMLKIQLEKVHRCFETMNEKTNIRSIISILLFHYIEMNFHQLRTKSI